MSLDQALELAGCGVLFLAIIAAGLGLRWFVDALHNPPEPAARFDARTDPNQHRDAVEHDWSCTTGTWPHAGFCCPGDTPGRSQRVFTLNRLTAAGAANYREDEGCAGED